MPRATIQWRQQRLLTRCTFLAVCAWVTMLSAQSCLTFLAAPNASKQPRHAARPGRREMLAASMIASGLAASAPESEAFAPGDLVSGKAAGTSSTSEGRFRGAQQSAQALQDALVLIGRVQEATVQEERLVTTGKFKDLQRNNIRMALTMMVDNYRLGDQVVVASGYVENKNKVLQASNIGNEAVDALIVANEYFARELKASKLTEDQRKFLVQALVSCRTKLDDFLTYLPAEAVQKARQQIEDENALNVKEFVGDEGIVNQVQLPWKKA